jgi:hypothetical protein
VRSATDDINWLGPLRSAVTFVRLTTRVIGLHGLLILLWASCYRWFCLGAGNRRYIFPQPVMPRLDMATWSCHETGGCWVRSSIDGVLTCGISVSLLFAMLTRLVSRDARIVASFTPAQEIDNAMGTIQGQDLANTIKKPGATTLVNASRTNYLRSPTNRSKQGSGRTQQFLAKICG